MSTRVLLVTGRVSVRDQMRALLGELEGIEVVGIVDDLDVVAAVDGFAPVEVVLVDEVVGDREGLDVVRELGLARPLTAVVLMAQRPTPELLAAAMDAGVRSVVTAPPSLEEIHSRLESAASWSRLARRHVGTDGPTSGDAGRVVAIAGGKGGVGASLLALLLARALASRSRVCLVDLDVRNGDLAAYTGVHVRRSIVDLVEVADEISGRALGETTYDIGHGVRLLGAPADGEAGEDLTARAARQILSALRYQFDLVVIDCGSRLDDATAVALELADRVVLVATPDVPALRAARRMLAAWERLEVTAPRDVALVLNRSSRTAEVQGPLAHKLVGVDVAAEVPLVGAALENVMNSGTVLAARIPELDRAIDRLAGAVLRSEERPTPADPQQPRRRPRRPWPARDAGQLAVEAPVVISLVALLTLVAIQLVVFGASHLFARHAAGQAAAAYGVGMDDAEVRDVVTDALPSGWDADWRIERPTSDSVRVALRTPSLLPGVLPRAASTSSIVWEPR